MTRLALPFILADRSNIKLVCKIVCGVLVLPGFVALSAFVLAIAPASGRTGAFVASDGAASRLHPTGFNPTIAGEK